MGKKGGQKSKKKIVLSLAEFNDDGGAAQQEFALPTAPRGADEWESVGGRPEYNSRGYKARQQKDRTYSEDAADHEWSRRGPMDGREDGQAGAGLGERNWGVTRRGPVDADDEEKPRNWDSMRRGPLEPADGPAPDRDWGARRGPVDAEAGGPRVIGDDQWNNARNSGGAVEAEFANRETGDRDWSVRKPVEAELPPLEREDWTTRRGPVEADIPEQSRETDWTARRGPVEAEIPEVAEERDWTTRKGPVEADDVRKEEGGDWSEMKRQPVEAELFSSKEERVDWGKRKGPIPVPGEEAPKPARDVDFGGMRRGAKLQEVKQAEPEKATEIAAGNMKITDVGRENWRRNNSGSSGKSFPGGKFRERPASTGHEVAAKERDWGSARRGTGIRNNVKPRPHSARRVSNPREFESKVEVATEDVVSDVTEDVSEDGDWTTVRSVNRRSLNRRNKLAKETVVAKGGVLSVGDK